MSDGPVFPRRGIIATLLTAGGLALLFSFKTPEKPAIQLSSTSGGPGGQAGSGTTTGQGEAGSGSASGADGASPPAGSPTPAPSSPGNGSRGAANGTVTGPVVDTRFGPVQVALTFQNGKITEAQALELPNDRMRSAEISQFVAPYLRQEVLQAQSAQIDLISGATYTSEGYAQDVQAILDQVGG